MDEPTDFEKQCADTERMTAEADLLRAKIADLDLKDRERDHKRVMERDAARHRVSMVGTVVWASAVVAVVFILVVLGWRG